MEQLVCKKCDTKSNSKFCPNCGEKIIQEMKTIDQISKMEELIDKALSIRKGDDRLYLLMISLMVKVGLSWVRGGGGSPVDFILIGDEYENNEEAKSLKELARLI